MSIKIVIVDKSDFTSVILFVCDKRLSAVVKQTIRGMRNLFTVEEIRSNASMLAWWVYFLAALTVFIGCISLSYIVKKMNETRIDERFIRLSQKAPASQATQVQYPQIEMETSRTIEPTIRSNSDDIYPAARGISLVFDKEDNLLNEKKRAIEEDLMQQVEQILAKKEDDVVTIKKSETNSDTEQNADSESRIDVIIKPTFLGNIYKSANNSVCNYRVNRDDQEGILNDMLDDIMSKVNDVKSSTSVKKFKVPENNIEQDGVLIDMLDEMMLKVNDVKNVNSTSSFKNCNVPEYNKEQDGVLIDMLDEMMSKVNDGKATSNVKNCNVPEYNKEQDGVLIDMLDEMVSKVNEVKSVKSTSSFKKCDVPENKE